MKLAKKNPLVQNQNFIDLAIYQKIKVLNEA